MSALRPAVLILRAALYCDCSGSRVAKFVGARRLVSSIKPRVREPDFCTIFVTACVTGKIEEGVLLSDCIPTGSERGKKVRGMLARGSIKCCVSIGRSTIFSRAGSSLASNDDHVEPS